MNLHPIHSDSTVGLTVLLIKMAAELDAIHQVVMDDRRLTHPLADQARAALDAPPEGEVGELVEWLRAKGREGLECGLEFAQENGRQLTSAAALLLQLSAAVPAVVPVPVSERLPGGEDCDAEGRCWVGAWCDVDGDRVFSWELDKPGALTWEGIQKMDGWLPAHAIPLPAPQGGEVEG